MNVRIKLSEFPRRNTSKWQRFPLWASVPWVPKVVRAKSRIVVCPEHSFYVKATVFNMSVPSENTWMCSKLVTKAFFLFALTEMMRTYQPGTTISSWAFSHNLDNCFWNLHQLSNNYVFQGKREAQLIIISTIFFSRKKKQQKTTK